MKGRALLVLAGMFVPTDIVFAGTPSAAGATTYAGSLCCGDGRGPAPSRNALPGGDRGVEVSTRTPPPPVVEVVPGATPEVTGAGATTDDAVTILDAAGLADLLAPAPRRARARIVALFATWCVPCEVELVQLTRLSSAAGAELLVVSLDAPGVDVRAWLSARGLRARVYHLPEADAAAAIFALAPDWPQTLPVSFVLPRDGRPVRRFDGVAPAEAIEALVR